jgi:hypothetical protein
MASPGIPKEQRGRREIASNECEYRVDRGVDGSGFPERRRADDLTVQASIIDGDTLESHETHVRLWGGDAPESSQPRRGEGVPCASLRLLSHGRPESSNGDRERVDRDDRRRSIGFNLRAETFMRVRQAPHRALVNRAAQRLGQ